MSKFNSSKKSKGVPLNVPGPYPDTATNLIYHLIFCDNIDLFELNTEKPYAYPFDILFNENSTVAELQKLIDDPTSEPRIKLLAYHLQNQKGSKPAPGKLLGVVVEVGLEGGLDTLASFSNATARYINQTGKMIVWENPDDVTVRRLTDDLFEKSRKIVSQIGPWNQPRKAFPPKGILRISFLVSDGLYFGEGPMNALFNDPMAGPALAAAAELMKYLTETAMATQE